MLLRNVDSFLNSWVGAKNSVVSQVGQTICNQTICKNYDINLQGTKKVTAVMDIEHQWQICERLEELSDVHIM